MEIKDLSELLEMERNEDSIRQHRKIMNDYSESDFNSSLDKSFSQAGDFPLENIVRVPGAKKLSEILFRQGLSDVHVYIPRKNIPVFKHNKIGVPVCRIAVNGIIKPPFEIELDKSIEEGSMFVESEDKAHTRRIRVTRSFSMDRMVEHIFMRILPIKPLPTSKTGAATFFKLYGEKPINEGLVLISGKTGSGKSSLLASILQEYLSKYPVHVLTIEDPIEYILFEGAGYATQKEVHTDVPDFPSALRLAMRETPNIILVGEIRDQETAISVLNAAETGHLVFGTIHAQEASGITERILGLTDGASASNQRIALTLKVCINVSNYRGFYTYNFTTMTDALRNLILGGSLRHWKTYAKEEEVTINANSGI
jgi:Tfp pilus assembly pilus retraction ATPase PilT